MGTPDVNTAREHFMNSEPFSRIVLKGYKSIVECDLTIGNFNVLIGPNGAGKSNFIGFFKLVQQIQQGKLQRTVSKDGDPDALWHFGRKKTAAMTAELFFANDSASYGFSLEPTADNRMMFGDENVCNGSSDKANHQQLGDGHFESAATNSDVAKSWRIYHFHDTSESAQLKRLMR
jgi:predicted ATPase